MRRAVLVVDEDPEFRAFAAAVLEPYGLEVVGLRSATAAFEEMSRRHFDFALFDDLLPDFPSREAIARHRQAGDTTPFLVISSQGLRPGAWPRLDAEIGIVAVLTKPVSPGSLLEHIRAVLPGLDKPSSSPGLASSGETSISPADQARATLAAKLAKVRERFHGKLAGKIDALAAALHRARETRAHSALEEAHLLAHSLHGVAGSFGLADVGGRAARIELAVKDALNEPEAFDGCWARLAPELAELLRATTREGSVTGHAPQSQTLTAVAAATTTRVLLLDDDPVFRRYLAELGRNNLIEVVCAGTGPEALALAAKTPDLDGMVIDVNLGKENAFEIAGALRSLPALADVPVSFVSSDDSMKTRLDASAVGASLFLQKPLDESAFLAAVQQMSAQRRSARPQVLVCDDDADFVELLRVTLEDQRIIVHQLTDPMDLLPALDRHSPDLLLLDVVLPQVSGFDLCRSVRATPRWRELPILFLSAQATPDARIACFRSGGDDYVQKPFLREELLARIGHRIERARLTRELGSKDYLTGLNNRREWLSVSAQRLAQAERMSGALAVAVLDVDKFKRVNDTFGHLAGDRVLAGLGRLLNSRFRIEDVRGRWGGEEFVLCFPGADAERAQAMLQRIAADFRRMEFKSDSGEVFHVTFSAGVASFPGDGHSVSELVRHADHLLGVAKRDGRDRVCR
jgi:diguanylate cyclase (GGDEF)-like protein